MVMLLSGSLLPLHQQIQSSVEMKKERLEAAETLYEAASMLRFGVTWGERMSGGVTYRWKYDGSLCVEYQSYSGKQVAVCES
ncbi:hypothetical protein [Indiicoccus explosivorum]|uniref:hypothetical protein n=1 Tax=Indiicoccus explosivorum TaxID=1917864 RepID=UPI000B450C63|nr:hypothetical protein [Indiicoccus explosivorum]